MNFSSAHSHLVAALTAFALSGVTSVSAAGPKPVTQPVVLQVSVDVPPTWRPFLEDDLADSLASRLTEIFRRRGFSGRIEPISSSDSVAKDVPCLRIRLVEWRIGRSGNADCTLNASLSTAAGEMNLGLVTTSAIFWPGVGGRWGMNRSYEVSDALENAADATLKDLYDRVAKTGIVAGLAKAK